MPKSSSKSDTSAMVSADPDESVSTLAGVAGDWARGGEGEQLEVLTGA